MVHQPKYEPVHMTFDAATEKRVAALLVGAIDTHVHTGPSIANRSLDHVEYAREASEAGFAAIVTKDHDYAGTMTAWMVRKHFPEFRTKVYSSIALNNVIGGMNAYAVEHAAAMGCKIVYMPTLTAANHFFWEKDKGRAHPGSTDKIRRATVVPVLNDDKTVRDDAKEILDVIAKTDMALASGHLHISETWIVFEEAQRRGVKRMILTHPEEIVYASLNDVKGIAAMGAAVEHSLCMFLEGNKFQHCNSEDLRNHITAAGVDNTIIASDLGQVGNISPIEGFRQIIKVCIDLGYSDADIRKMVSINAAKKLGIENDLPAH
jgi:hypothetical protein